MSGDPAQAWAALRAALPTGAVATARVRVTSGTDGALGSLGHRLVFEADGVDVLHEDGRVRAEVPVRALRLLGVHRPDAAPDAHRLSARDQRRVLSVLHEKVLPESVAEAVAWEARLPTPDAPPVLHGVARWGRAEQPVALPLDVRSGADGGVGIGATFVLRHAAWGLRPYSALAGQLRVSDEVEVEVDVRMAPGAP